MNLCDIDYCRRIGFVCGIFGSGLILGGGEGGWGVGWVWICGCVGGMAKDGMAEKGKMSVIYEGRATRCLSGIWGSVM